MKYQITNIPTLYRNTLFRSRLEARWAAFADLAGWKWKYEPIDLKGWIPDFWFGIPCGHSECCGVATERCPKCASPERETLDPPAIPCPDINGKIIDYMPQPRRYQCRACRHEYPTWTRANDFLHELYAEVKPYSSIKEFDGHPVTLIDEWEVPSPARFGIDPSVSEWTMAHGAGAGVEDATNWISRSWEDAWNEAGNLTRFRRTP